MSREPTLRFEAGLKVSGRAIYPAEISAEDLLHAVLVPAPIVAGEVRVVDASAARTVAGFADFVSYDEARDLKPSSMTALIRERTIHSTGQPVALVAAETLLAARLAAREVRVDCDATSAVTAMHQALDHAYVPEKAGRLSAQSLRGDIDVGFARSAFVLRDRWETSVNNHHPLEPHAVVCWWDGDKPTVHVTTQAVFATRGVIAHAFQIPAENARVITRFLGGGFGCKGQLFFPWMFLAMLASRRTGRPVRLELTRAELFTLVGRRSETRQELGLGFAADGAITAIDLDVLAQTSTHAEHVDGAIGAARWLYACANVATVQRLVRTNEPHPLPMRAPGSAPATFALESALDEAAERLGIDPVALRIRNFADHDQEAGKRWSSNGLLECYRIGAERFGWSARPARETGVDGRWRTGCGMATTYYPQHWQPCRARVALSAEAKLTIQCGTQDMGSGTYTLLAQLASDALGVPIADVTVELGDTLLPPGPISAGSQVTSSLSPAVAMATHALRAKLAAMAVADDTSPLAGHDPAELDFRHGMIVSRAGNAAEPLADLIARQAPDGIEAAGSAEPPSQAGFSTMGFGAIFVEAGVDPDLGEIRVRRVCGAFAAGRIVNPLLAESQFVGGLVGGIGMALHERTVTDRATGRILGAGFADYLIPVHADMPTFDIAMIDEDDPHAPGGVKGIGMLGTAGIQAAIANAVFDAVGKRVRRLPIRIEDILGDGV